MATLYNEREQPVQLTFQDQERRILSQVDLLYDEAGRLIEEAQTRSDEPIAPGTEEFNPAQVAALRDIFTVRNGTSMMLRGAGAKPAAKSAL